MASSLKFLCFFLLLTTLSSQIHARDSQFFSKVSRNRDPAATITTATTTNTNTNNNNKALKETEFVPLSSFKQQDQVEEEEDPTFLPETEGSGYGFYGHETGLDPPSTTTPTTTTTTTTTNNIHDHEMNYAKELKGLKEYNNNDNNNYYFDNNNKVVDQGKYFPTYEKQGMSDTRFMENGGAGYYGGAEKQEITDFPESTTTTPKFLGNSNKYYSTYGGAGYNGGVQRQGMSDTRFMENGKYFYDVNAEINNNNNNNNKYYNPNNYNNNNNNEYNNNKYYNPNNYNNNNNNEYNNNYNNEYMVKNNGYYGNYKENNYGDFYNNNNNNNNGYKNNQVPEEEEFDFDP